MVHRVLLLGFACCLAVLLFAQDPAKVDPSIATVVLENQDVRVLRLHYQPHQKFATHTHPKKLVVFLTDQHARITLPDGKTREATAKRGDVAYRTPETHMVENLSDQPLETIEIELKK